TAVGQSTHLAARMQQSAAPETIRATANTVGLAEGAVAVIPLGPVSVKGVSDPVDVYEVTGVGPGRSRLRAALARGLTRFFGRDVELEEVRRALDRTRAGTGQSMIVGGETSCVMSRLRM